MSLTKCYRVTGACKMKNMFCFKAETIAFWKCCQISTIIQTNVCIGTSLAKGKQAREGGKGSEKPGKSIPTGEGLVSAESQLNLN